MYIERGIELIGAISEHFDITILASDEKPLFTAEEEKITDHYVERLNRDHQLECERLNGGYEYHPDLLPYIQRTVVGFALKQCAKTGSEELNWRDNIASIMKSWLFDRDPISWIRIRDLLSFSKSSKWDEKYHQFAVDAEKKGALRAISLFPSYMKSRTEVEINLTAVSAAVIGIHIPEMRPIGGIFGPDSLADVSTHLRMAEDMGLLN